MADTVAPEEYVGPLNPVELMLVQGEHNRHDAEIRRLEDVRKNLQASIDQTTLALQSLKNRQSGMLREVLKQRGKDPGKLPMRVSSRIQDNTTWIVVGGQPQA